MGAASVRVALPPQLVEDARAFADGTREPAEPPVLSPDLRVA